MDLLEQVAEGFRGITAPDVYKQQALTFLGQWLTRPDFAAYVPQLHWLIETKQWPGLLERFYQIGQTVNGLVTLPDGPIKTFTLRGIKDSPPYLHDGRLLTLADTVEFFNLVLGLKLNQQEKDDLVAYMLTL